jgi:hypothetical protein
MSTAITINVTNNSAFTQNIFFFQEPAVYVGGQQVYSNSLYTNVLQPYATSGAVSTFTVLLQYYAGVQQQIVPPQVGQPSGYESAIRPIDLTPAAGGAPTNNTTAMTVSPSLGLSVPANSAGVPPGSFRIVSPAFNPTLTPYNAGSAVQRLGGGIILSNFVTAQPSQNIDCQPILKFYVATGSYSAGTVMDFTNSSSAAALCDASTGFTTFNVDYNIDGTWSVTPMA